MKPIAGKPSLFKGGSGDKKINRGIPLHKSVERVRILARGKIHGSQKPVTRFCMGPKESAAKKMGRV